MHWALGAPCGLGEKGAFVLVGKRKAVWRGMASQGYEIRLFDKRIASFTFETNCFGESPSACAWSRGRSDCCR